MVLSRLSAFLPLLAASLLLAACGFGAQPTPTPEPITLRYVTFAGLDAADQVLIDAFRTSHAYVTVTPETYSRAPADYLDATVPPDLMFITPGEFLEAAVDRGALVDLTDLWQQAGVDEQVAGALSALSERGGKQYYVPVGYNWNGVYYNQPLFEQYGLQPPRTWDEFTQLAETLWLEGIVPFSISGSDPFMGTACPTTTRAFVLSLNCGQCWSRRDTFCALPPPWASTVRWRRWRPPRHPFHRRQPWCSLVQPFWMRSNPCSASSLASFPFPSSTPPSHRLRSSWPSAT